MRVIFDQNTPRKLGRFLTGHQIRTADEEGWSELENGALLTAAENAGFACMVTADRNMSYQQNLSGRRIALVVLSTNAWPVIRENPAIVLAAVNMGTPGSYQEVTFDRAQSRRRRQESDDR